MPETAEVKEFALEAEPRQKNVIKPATQTLAEARRKVMPGKRKVTVWLPEDLYLKVETEATKDERDVSTWLSRRLREALEDLP
jgi:hypothetical protein